MPPALTIAGALAETARKLSAAGIEGAKLDARLLLGRAIGAGPGTLVRDSERALSGNEAARLEALAERRARREPMSHVLGVREFWSLEFRVTKDTLDPRPDSETVIEAALAAIGSRDGALNILDLGTGTGCLLLALLSELPAAHGTGVDISPAALAVAQENADALGFSGRAVFRAGDWGRQLAGRFDVIVANPPYVRRDDIRALQPEIAQFEPEIALDGGPDGLDCYRAMADDLTRLTTPRGFAAVEIGEGQDVEVTRIFSKSGLEIRAVWNDLTGTRRCLVVAPADELTVT